MIHDISNADRADWALSALGGFVERTRVDTGQDAITDLIANMLHLARGRNLDTERILTNAASMVEQEVGEDEQGDMASVQQHFRTLLPIGR